MCLDFVKKFKDRHAQCIGNDFHGVERRVGPAVFDAAEVGLIKAAPFPKFHLALATGKPQLAHAGTKEG